MRTYHQLHFIKWISLLCSIFALAAWFFCASEIPTLGRPFLPLHVLLAVISGVVGWFEGSRATPVQSKRRIVSKRFALVASVLVGVVCLMSTLLTITWTSGDRNHQLGLSEGVLFISWSVVPDLLGSWQPVQSGWVCSANTSTEPFWDYGIVQDSPLSWVAIPIWGPIILAAVPTIWLWSMARKRTPPGHCLGCGYNLTGNVSGVCPECGTPIPAETMKKVTNESENR